MNTAEIILGVCGVIWLLVVLATLLWFAWLHYKGELIDDVPDDLRELF